MLIKNLNETIDIETNKSQINQTKRQATINKKIWAKSRSFLSKTYGFGDNHSLFEVWAKYMINDYGRLILQLDSNSYLKKALAKNKTPEVISYLNESQRQVDFLLARASKTNKNAKNLSECLKDDSPLLIEQSQFGASGKKVISKKAKTAAAKKLSAAERKAAAEAAAKAKSDASRAPVGNLSRFDTKPAATTPKAAPVVPAPAPKPKVKNPGDAQVVADKAADKAAQVAQKKVQTAAKTAPKGSAAGLTPQAQKEVEAAIKRINDIYKANQTGTVTAAVKKSFDDAAAVLVKNGRSYKLPIRPNQKVAKGLPQSGAAGKGPNIKTSELSKSARVQSIAARGKPKPKVKSKFRGSKYNKPIPVKPQAAAEVKKEVQKIASKEGAKAGGRLSRQGVIKLGQWMKANPGKTILLVPAGLSLFGLGWGVLKALSDEDGSLPKPPTSGGGASGGGAPAGPAGSLSPAQQSRQKRLFYKYAKQVTGINEDVKAGIEIMRLLVDAGYEVSKGAAESTPFAVRMNDPEPTATPEEPDASDAPASNVSSDQFQLKTNFGSMPDSKGPMNFKLQEHNKNDMKQITKLWENWLVSEQDKPIRGKVKQLSLSSGRGTSGDGLQDTLAQAISQQEKKTRQRVQTSQYKQYGIDGIWDMQLHSAILLFQQDLVNANKMPAKSKKGGNNVDGIVGPTTYPFLNQMADGELKIPRTVDPKPEEASAEEAPAETGEIEIQAAQDFIDQRIDKQSRARLKKIDDQLNKAFKVNGETTGKSLMQLKAELFDQVNEFEQEGKEVPEKLRSRLNNIRRRIDTLEAIRDDILAGPKNREMRKQAEANMKKAASRVFKLIRDKVKMYANRSGRTRAGRNVKSGNPAAKQVIAFAMKYGLMNNAIFWVSWAARDINSIDVERKKSGINPTEKLTTPPMASEKTSAKFETLIQGFNEALAIYQKAIPKNTQTKRKELKTQGGNRSWWSWLLPPEDAPADYYDVGDVI